MANQLFEQFGNQPNNQISAFIGEVKKMQQSFNGDPKAEVQKLLNSGQLSQSDFNRFAQIANQIAPMIK